MTKTQRKSYVAVDTVGGATYIGQKLNGSTREVSLRDYIVVKSEEFREDSDYASIAREKLRWAKQNVDERSKGSVSLRDPNIIAVHDLGSKL